MDQLQSFLENTDYRIYDASNLSIYEIQDKLRECRLDDQLIVFIEKNTKSNSFFERLIHFNLDKQHSNYYIGHSRNYAVWVKSNELERDELLVFLKHSRSSCTELSDTFLENERVV